MPIMLPRRGSNIISLAFAALTWFFLRQPAEESAPAPIPATQFIYLTEASMDELCSGDWYVVVGEIAEHPEIRHVFGSAFHIAYLPVSSMASSRIAALLNVRKYGEVVAVSNGALWDSPGDALDIPRDVSWVDTFDYYFFFISCALKRRGLPWAYAGDVIQAAAGPLVSITGMVL